jgi:hypothetical protein
MRVRTALAVVILTGIASFGVPSAAADELPPTPAETSAVTAPADEPVAAPTSDPLDVPTSEATPPEPEETAAPNGESVEPAGEESPSTADEATGDATETTDQAQLAQEPDNSQTSPAAQTLAASAEEIRDPRASIGDINCANLTVPVTLDNSRSTEPVNYEVLAEVVDIEGDLDRVLQARLPADALRIVNVPLTEDTRIWVQVFADTVLPPPGPFFNLALAVITVDCSADDDPRDPQARIGDVDCAAMTLEVTLDNSRSEEEVNYRVAVDLEERLTYEQIHNVPAGEVASVPVPVTENSVILVSVADEDLREGDMLFQRIRVDCMPGDGPRASIDEVNCTNLTVPVTLDNTESSVETSFSVVATETNLVDNYAETFNIMAGAVRVVPVPVSKNLPRKEVIVSDAAWFQIVFAHEVFDINCPRTAARPTVAVEDAKLPQTGGLNLAIPLLGVALLAGGTSTLALSGRRLRY